MKKHQLENADRIQLLGHASREMPHATLETNHTCNMRCAFCYNEDRQSVKSLGLILDELKQLQLARPHLHTITLLGGEPLLLPYLPSVVKAIRATGTLCQIMTNGLALLQSNGHELLLDLIKAGVNRFALHVDQGQGEYDVINQRRQDLYHLLETHKIHFSLTLTISDATQGILPSLIQEGASFQYFDGILAFLATDQENPLRPETKLPAEHLSILKELHVNPSSYVSSSKDTLEVRWLMYHFLLSSKTKKCLEISPKFNSIFTRVFRMFKGCNPFMVLVAPVFSGIGSMLTFALETILNPPAILKRFRQIGGIKGLWQSRFVFIAVGVPPEIGNNSEIVEICYHCPDATIRNGKFMPVCIADHISPLESKNPIDPKFESILLHLKDAL